MVVLSVSGVFTTNDALTGLIPFLGGWIIHVGALVGFLAVITSYLALGYDLRKMYELDRGIASAFSWALVTMVPLGLFIAGATDFIRLMSLVGGFFIALDGALIVIILRRIPKEGSIHTTFLPFNTLIQVTLVSVFILSAFHEVLYQLR